MRVVVIPCKNECASIARLVEGALEHVDAVIVADDGSTDGSAELAASAGASVFEVPRSRRGMAGVYRAGLEFALRETTAEVVVEMDAGGSHDPADLPRILEEVDRAAVVFGRRFGPGARYEASWRRVLLSWCGTLLTNFLSKHWFWWWWDATSGFIAYRRGALQLLLSQPTRCSGHYYQTEVRNRALDLGLVVQEVPITYRSSGTSLNWYSIREALRLALSRRA